MNFLFWYRESPISAVSISADFTLSRFFEHFKSPIYAVDPRTIAVFPTFLKKLSIFKDCFFCQLLALNLRCNSFSFRNLKFAWVSCIVHFDLSYFMKKFFNSFYCVLISILNKLYNTGSPCITRFHIAQISQ